MRLVRLIRNFSGFVFLLFLSLELYLNINLHVYMESSSSTTAVINNFVLNSKTDVIEGENRRTGKNPP